MKRLLIITTFLFSVSALSNIGHIPLSNEGLPAADLYSSEFGELDSEYAQELREEGLDLSTLDPIDSNLWSKKNKINDFITDVAMPITSGDTLEYSGTIDSSEGVLRFNGYGAQGNFQVHLSKTLHTILLRKNLLRSLGYVVPASKYLKKIRIEFRDGREKDFFKDVELVSQLGASYKNWLVSETETSLVLKDIYVTKPKENDFYDVALTSLNDTKDLRVLRSLVIPYSLLDLPESINKFGYKFINIKNDNIILNYPTATDFNATIDDIRWITKLIANLSRQDIVRIVRQSHFPQLVETILIEKIIARRNNIVSTLDISSDEIAFTKKFKDKRIKDSFLAPIDFKDYATKFSFGAKESPLEDIPSFILGEGQSMAIKGLMGLVNSKLKAFDPTEAKVKWLKEDFENNKDFALDYFQKNGEFPPLSFSSWKTPIVNGNIIFGRDIAVGQNFGTDDFVQLADTIGFAASIGMYFGLERVFSQTTSGSLFPNLGITTNYTHVRPITTLKEALKTPYKNMFVGLTLSSMQKDLIKAKEANTNIVDKDERLQRLSELTSQISKSFGIGESIIISTSIIPDMTLSLNAPLYGVGNGYGSIGLKYKELSRIQIRRKSKYKFHIYYDDAIVKEIKARGGISYYIPIIMAEGKSIKSKLDMKFYEVDINPEQDELEYAKNLVKLITLLKHRTNEGMGPEDIQVYNDSIDKAFNLNLLFFVKKSLKSMSEIFVRIKRKVELKFISASYGEMSGINLGSFARNLAAYGLKQIINNIDVSFDKSLIPTLSEAKHYYKNPGKNLFGSSTTYETKFESKLIDPSMEVRLENLSEQYMYFTKRFEKAVVKEKSVKKYLKKENEYFNAEFFNENDSKDAGDMHYARLETKIHFFDKAVKKMLDVTSEELSELAKKVKTKSNCRRRRKNGMSQAKTISQKLRCGDYSPIKRKLYWCKKYIKKNKTQKGLQCLSNVGQYFSKYIDVKNLLDFFGKDNLYIESQLSGYRIDSEVMSKPIVGRTYGKINSRNFGGPINKLIGVLGLIKAEVHGYWYRDTLK